MGDMYRSRTMSYVRLLIAEESAYDSIRQLGEWGRLMVVDLSLAPSNSAALLSDRVTRLKKRIAGCQYWEKRLDMLRDIMLEHAVELPAIGDDDVRVADVRTADVLEAAAAYIEPLDAAVSKNTQFKREQTHTINRMAEMMHVLDAVVHPDSQSDVQRRQRRQREEKERSAGRPHTQHTSNSWQAEVEHATTAHVCAIVMLCALLSPPRYFLRQWV